MRAAVMTGTLILAVSRAEMRPMITSEDDDSVIGHAQLFQLLPNPTKILVQTVYAA